MASFFNIGFLYPWALIIIPAPWIIYHFFPSVKPAITNRVHAPSLFFLAQNTLKKNGRPCEKCLLNTPVFIILWFSSVLAAAHPFYFKVRKVDATNPVSAIIALDTSKSMAINDSAIIIHPGQKQTTTRLEAAKIFIEKFISQHPEYTFSLVLFGDASCVASPFTYDHKSLLSITRSTETGMAGDKTAIGNVIIESTAIMKNNGHTNSHNKMIILITDGENTSGEISPVYAAQKAASQNIPVYTLMVGKENSGLTEENTNNTLNNIAYLTKARHLSIEYPETFNKLGYSISKKIKENHLKYQTLARLKTKASLVIWPQIVMIAFGLIWIHRYLARNLSYDNS